MQRKDIPVRRPSARRSGDPRGAARRARRLRRRRARFRDGRHACPARRPRALRSLPRRGAPRVDRLAPRPRDAAGHRGDRARRLRRRGLRAVRRDDPLLPARAARSRSRPRARTGSRRSTRCGTCSASTRCSRSSSTSEAVACRCSPSAGTCRRSAGSTSTTSRSRHDDPLHWTGPFQNWNYMCAECHSTELRRGFDLATNTYDTTWKEIDVGCQACHGPGSEHVAWAERVGEGGRLGSGRSQGPRRAISAPRTRRSRSRRARAATAVATSCTASTSTARPLLDHYDPELLVAPLYHADGQILDEVYVYGSFLQSKMHAKGVRCTDCHDPHTTRLKHEGNDVCVRCHQPTPPRSSRRLAKRAYDGPAHHHHDAGHAGLLLRRLPHARHDLHAGRSAARPLLPRPASRPDRGRGVPNACNGCHETESAPWAVETIRAWFPERRASARRTSPRRWRPLARGEAGAAPGLARRSPPTASARRSCAPRRCARCSASRIAGVLDACDGPLEDHEGLVRAAAVDGVNGLIPRGAPPEALRLKVAILAPRLADPLRLVRTEAARGWPRCPRPARRGRAPGVRRGPGGVRRAPALRRGSTGRAG